MSSCPGTSLAFLFEQTAQSLDGRYEIGFQKVFVPFFQCKQVYADPSINEDEVRGRHRIVSIMRIYFGTLR